MRSKSIVRRVSHPWGGWRQITCVKQQEALERPRGSWPLGWRTFRRRRSCRSRNSSIGSKGFAPGQRVPISTSLDNDPSMHVGDETGSQGIVLLCSYPGYVAGSAGPFHGPYHGRENLGHDRKI